MYWTTRALDHALALGDPRVTTYILMRRSDIAADLRDPGHALSLADTALKNMDELTPRLRAVSLRCRAKAHAMLGERSRSQADSEDALAQAVEGYLTTEDDRAGYCSPAFIEMEVGASLVGLGQVAAAIPTLERSRVRLHGSPQVRDRTLCLARLATAYAVTGGPEQARDVPSELLPFAQSLGSTRVLAQLKRLQHRLTRWSRDPATGRVAQSAGSLGRLIPFSGTAARGSHVMDLLPRSTTTEERARSARVAVLPVGSFEQHGNYLPLITDTVVACAISQELADAYGLLLLPPITISCSHEHSAWPGTTSISARTLHAIVTDVYDSVIRSGPSALVVVNGHGGNYVLGNVVQEANARGERMGLFPQRADWDDARVAGQLATTMSEDMHAGEIETSILLHVAPDLVGDGNETADHVANDRRHLLTTGIQPYTVTGVIGRPSLGAADKGKAVLDSLVSSFASLLSLLDDSSQGNHP
jgi:creatinine amidohydrolase